MTGAGRGIGRAVGAAPERAGAPRRAHWPATAPELDADRRRVRRAESGRCPPTSPTSTRLTRPSPRSSASGGRSRCWSPTPAPGTRRALERTTDERLAADARPQPDRAVPLHPPGRAGDARGRWGRIVVVASTAAKIGEPYIAAYTASKHGVLGAGPVGGGRAGPTGVTVNAVCPAYVDTPMTDATVATIAATTGRSPRGGPRRSSNASSRSAVWSQPDEVADAVWFCVDNAAITGQAHQRRRRSGPA